MNQKLKENKKKLAVTGKSKEEQKTNMKVVNKIIKQKQGNIQMDKAVNQSITTEQQQRKRRRTK